MLASKRLIPDGAVDPKYIEESMDTPDTGSFMHLHLGIDAKGLDNLDIHYSVRSAVLESPSLADESITPTRAYPSRCLQLSAHDSS